MFQHYIENLTFEKLGYLILVFVIIYIVEKIYNINSFIYGTVSIPGIPETTKKKK
jgi:hypothetical protein